MSRDQSLVLKQALGTPGGIAGSHQKSKKWNGALRQVTRTAHNPMSCSWKVEIFIWKMRSKFTSFTMSLTLWTHLPVDLERIQDCNEAKVPLGGDA